MIRVKAALNGAATTFMLATLVSGPTHAADAAVPQPLSTRQFPAGFSAVTDPAFIGAVALQVPADPDDAWALGVLTQQDLDLLDALGGPLASNDDGVDYGSLFANDEL